MTSYQNKLKSPTLISETVAGQSLPSTRVPAGGAARRGQGSLPYLHSVLRVSGFVDTALAHRVGAHPDVLLDLVAIGEVDIVPM